MKRASQKRICIIEDNETLRQAYTMLIDGIDQYSVVGAYATCENALKNLRKDQPDIILMDLELPGMHGIEGIKIIKEHFPHIDILVVTAHDDSEHVYQSLCAGACGYITKSTHYLELLSAIEQVVEGGAPLSTNIARMVVESFRRNAASPLSKRETEVLSLLAKGHNYTSIATRLQLSRETVKTHIKNVYQKLHVSSKAEAVSKARNKRYI